MDKVFDVPAGIKRIGIGTDIHNGQLTLVAHGFGEVPFETTLLYLEKRPVSHQPQPESFFIDDDCNGNWFLIPESQRLAWDAYSWALEEGYAVELPEGAKSVLHPRWVLTKSPIVLAGGV